MKKQTFKLFAMVALFATVCFAACKKETTPVADFSYSYAYAKVDTFYFSDTVSFTNLSKDADTYTWNFGDSTTSTEKNPKKYFGDFRFVREYTNFSITLTATKDGKSSTKTKTIVGYAPA